MLHLTYDTWDQYLPCYIWHMTPDIVIWHAMPATWYMTPLFDMLYLPHDILHRYLTYYACHLIYDMLYLPPDIDTCHAIFDRWYPTPVLVLLHLSLDIRHWFLICHTWHLLLTPGIWYDFMWYEYLDLTSWLLTGHYHSWYLIIWHIHDYHYYGDMTWLLYYYYQIFGTPELLYSCILEPLK